MLEIQNKGIFHNAEQARNSCVCYREKEQQMRTASSAVEDTAKETKC
jgi:hypothetical protein